MTEELLGPINHDPPMPVTITRSGEDLSAEVIGRWVHVVPGQVSRGPYDTRYLLVRFTDGTLATIDVKAPVLDDEPVTLSNVDYP